MIDIHAALRIKTELFCKGLSLDQSLMKNNEQGICFFFIKYKDNYSP